MNKLFSYIVKNDGGAAPNPYYGVCTMTICKPNIRKTAEIGDWVFGTGGKSSKCNDGKIHDLSSKLVIAMQVTGIMTIKEYYEYCKENLPNKIPNWRTQDWRDRVGDCLYHYDNDIFRSVKGVHLQKGQKRDLGGRNTLLSTNFYYFGEKAIDLPTSLLPLVKKGQGYNTIRDIGLVKGFEDWITNNYEKNKIYGEPQFRWRFDKQANYGF